MKLESYHEATEIVGHIERLNRTLSHIKDESCSVRIWVNNKEIELSPTLTREIWEVVISDFQGRLDVFNEMLSKL